MWVTPTGQFYRSSNHQHVHLLTMLIHCRIVIHVQKNNAALLYSGTIHIDELKGKFFKPQLKFNHLLKSRVVGFKFGNCSCCEGPFILREVLPTKSLFQCIWMVQLCNIKKLLTTNRGVMSIFDVARLPQWNELKRALGKTSVLMLPDSQNEQMERS